MGLNDRLAAFSVVHILWHGRTFCGLDPSLKTWPLDHFWVGRHTADIPRATCPACMHNERLPF